MKIKDKTLLVTGGTGSFGTAVLNRFLHTDHFKEIRIFSRDDYTCQYCGARGIKLECDHVHPVSRGGSHDDSNLVTACVGCNRAKRAKTVAEWKGGKA